MKKSKLLMPIITGVMTAGLIGSTGLLITSCKSKEKFDIIEGAKTDVTIIGNNMIAELQFILRGELSSNQEIIAEPVGDTGKFTFDKAQVNGRLVTVPVYWLESDWSEEMQWNNSINFTLKNTKSGSTIWKKTIQNCKVTYLPYCELAPGQQKNIVSNEIDKDSSKTVISKFKLYLPNGKPSGIRTRFEVQVKDNDDEFDIVEDNVTVTAAREKNTLLVTVPAKKSDESGVVAGDSFSFDLQVYCMYGNTDIPVWISAPFKGLSCSYIDESNPIPVEYMEFEPYPEYDDYCILTAIKSEAASGGYTSFEIPVKVMMSDGKERIVTQIGKGNTLDIPETVTTLIFGGTRENPSEIGYFGNNAFKGCTNFRYIDGSNIYNSAEQLQEIQFGTDSFSGWNEDGGTIIWGDEFSTYKRHMLIAKLYAGGLTNTNWYNITEVSTEQQLREACATGQNIKLANNITIKATGYYTGQIDIRQSLVMDLNGKTVTSEQPIFDYDSKDFAIFGVWSGADVVITDTSENHDGSIKAFDQSANFRTNTPTEPEKDDIWWDWSDEKQSYRPRESRCFYIRTDTPKRDETSLEILAGNYWGNCTTVMNWNGSCWIEEPIIFRTAEHKYAPTFHAYTPYFIPNQEEYEEPANELINCDNGSAATGDAYFEVYGGKFYGVKNHRNIYCMYDPREAKNDPVPDPEGGGTKPANWLANEQYRDLYDVSLEYDGNIPYNLVYRKQDLLKK